MSGISPNDRLEVDAPQSITLQYAGPGTPLSIRDNLAFKLAVGFWLAPLIVGVFSFVAWLVTRRQIFEIVGIYTVLIGTLCALLGVFFVFCFIVSHWGKSSQPWKQVMLPGVTLVALIGSNFFIALGIMTLVEWVENHNWTLHG